MDLPKDVTATVLKEIPEMEPMLAHSTRTQKRHEEGAWTLQNGDEVLDDDLLRRVGDKISNAKRPVIYAGQGVIQSPRGVEMLREFAEIANVPVTTTLQGMGCFDELHPLSLRMLGMHGAAYVWLDYFLSPLLSFLPHLIKPTLNSNMKIQIRKPCSTKC